MNKLTKVQVNTSKGLRYIHFQLISDYNNEEKKPEYICKHCSYEKVCNFLPDPEHPEDNTYRFCDFCTRIGDMAETKEEAEIRNMHPVQGTIENELGDVFPNIISILNERNILIPLDRIIDSVCPGMCDNYTPDHSGCAGGGLMCLLQDLFKKDHKPIDINKSILKYDTYRIEDIDEED